MVPPYLGVSAVLVPGAVDVAVDVFVVDVEEVVHEDNELNSTADAIIAPPPFRKSRLVTEFFLLGSVSFRSCNSISYLFLLNQSFSCPSIRRWLRLISYPVICLTMLLQDSKVLEYLSRGHPQ